MRAQKLGRVVLSPIDVVLDPAICGDRVWAAPALVVEVVSTHTRRHDRPMKLEWYRTSGVHESGSWIPSRLDRPVSLSTVRIPSMFEEGAFVRSALLPGLRLSAGDAFRTRLARTFDGACTRCADAQHRRSIAPQQRYDPSTVPP